MFSTLAKIVLRSFVYLLVIGNLFYLSLSTTIIDVDRAILNVLVMFPPNNDDPPPLKLTQSKKKYVYWSGRVPWRLVMPLR